MNMDRIEKKVVLKAPLERVWRAISDSQQFGSWFGMDVDGPFAEGRRVLAKIVPTTVDAEVAAMQKQHEGVAFELWIERVEPLRRLSFRWPACMPEPGVELAEDQMTLVVFELEQVADGVLLTITESGFERIPLERRAQAFEGNEGGWQIQTTLIARYLAADAGG